MRPGNAAAHTAADHFEVLQLALEQLLEVDLGREILARADIGGRTHAFTQDCRDASICFSVGYEVDARVREVIAELPESVWQSANDGDVREGAQVTELTDRINLSSWPEGTRLIVRRERPIPAPSSRSSAARPATAFSYVKEGAELNRSAGAAPGNRSGAVYLPQVASLHPAG